jgi:hypothetical protein
MRACDVESADSWLSLRRIPSYYSRRYSHTGTVIGTNAKKIELFRHFTPDLQKGNLPAFILPHYIKLVIYVNASLSVYAKGLASFEDYVSLFCVLVSYCLLLQVGCPICGNWRYRFDFIRQGLAYACVGIEEDDRICKLECSVNGESFVVPATKQSSLPVQARNNVLVPEGARVVGEDNKLFAYRVYRQVIREICRGSSVRLPKGEGGKAKVPETPFVHASNDRVVLELVKSRYRGQFLSPYKGPSNTNRSPILPFFD